MLLGGFRDENAHRLKLLASRIFNDQLVFHIHFSHSYSFHFRSFNSVYQKCCRANRETVVLQLVNSYCKPHLLYATECLQLSHTAIKKLKSACLCALSKIFRVKGINLDFISEMFERYTFETEVAIRQHQFCGKLTMMNSRLFIPFIALHV